MGSQIARSNSCERSHLNTIIGQNNNRKTLGGKKWIYRLHMKDNNWQVRCEYADHKQKITISHEEGWISCGHR